MQSTKNPIKTNIPFLKKLIQKNGPDPSDYKTLSDWYTHIWEASATGQLSKEETDQLRNYLSAIYNDKENLLGFCYTKPHGYAGDFEIIEKIYTDHISQNPKHKKWDLFFHSFKAPQAVKNRKTYFKNLLLQKASSKKTFKVLNLASGPCRDLLEFYTEHPDLDVRIDCVELDHNAINYAKSLLGDYNTKIKFIHQNIFRFRTSQQYDLVWSAGLFDYFNDSTFTHMLSTFYKNVAPKGELIIGNVHPRNTSRAIMEFAEWSLHHRTESQLVDLAIESGIKDYSKIKIEQEPIGINLFLRINQS